MKNKRNIRHTFAVCAYGESEYLRDCLTSVTTQEYPSKVIVCTATPNDHIKALCEEFQVPLWINPDKPGIATDWNFAMRCADTPYVTLAHQDDVYSPLYSHCMLSAAKRKKGARPVILFSDYGEIRNGKIKDQSLLLFIKRLMLVPLIPARLSDKRLAKRLVLAFGNPICCPAVTYVMPKLRNDLPLFDPDYGSNLDWQTWEKLSRAKGGFCYVRRRLMFHRVHEASTTSRLIGDHTRKKEDLAMLLKFWPKPVAKGIGKIYGLGERLNRT